MKSIKTVLFSFLLSGLCISQNERSLGLIKSDIDTAKIIKKKVPVTRSGLPYSFSLQRYSPPAGYQGNLGSCTSWATAYCAFTIVKRVEAQNNNMGPFDPLNLHSRLKAMNNQDPCTGANYVEQASSMLQSNGCPVMSFQNCEYLSASKTYQDRLYSYSQLSINYYDFKYVLSQESSPIIIAADYYTDGWGNTSNLRSGVWNGYCGGIKNGAHAMVIIGYDDYKSGGAFLVQNSWGTDWGENGCFWIRYSDISKVIYEAIQFVKDPYGNHNSKNDNYNDEDIDLDVDDDVNNNNYNQNSNQQVFRFYNDCHLTTYVTLSQYTGSNWVTKGWYAISRGSYLDLDISSRDENSVYWMATAINNGKYIDWVDNLNGTDMCFDRVNAHTIYDNASPSCPEVAKFYKTVPTTRTDMVTMNLTCSNISTRGSTSEIVTNFLGHEIAKGEDTNVNWNGKSTLIDIYSSRIINPISSAQKGEVYDIYYLNNNKVVHFNGTAAELTKIKAPKFSSKKNAEAYMSVSNK